MRRRIENRFNLRLLLEIKKRKENAQLPLGTPNKGKTDRINIYSLDSLSGKEFERFLKWLFEEMGYQVQPGKYVADSGVDLVVSKAKETIAVQAKRYNRCMKVSNSVILKTQGGMNVYGCQSAVVVTTSYFTQAAVSDAAKLNIDLWDRDVLAAKIDEINAHISDGKQEENLPTYKGSLFESLLALDKTEEFYIEPKENGKYDLHMHGIKYPLISFQTRFHYVSKCVLRFENKQPVGESDGRKIIWSDAHYTYGNQHDAYQKITRYLSQFLE